MSLVNTTMKTLDHALGNNLDMLPKRDPTDTDMTPQKAVILTVMTTSNVFMLLGNSSSLFIILKSPSLRQHTYYWLVLNLAVLDMMNSMFVVPINIVWEFYGYWPFSQLLCDLEIFCDLGFSTVAAYSTVLVSVDKYLYINKPFFYHSHVGAKSTIISIILTWLIWMSYSAASVFGGLARSTKQYKYTAFPLDKCNFVLRHAYAITSFFLVFFIPLVILLFTSSSILYIARQHIRKIHSNQHLSDSDRDVVASFNSEHLQNSNNNSSHHNTASSETLPSMDKNCKCNHTELEQSTQNTSNYLEIQNLKSVSINLMQPNPQSTDVQRSINTTEQLAEKGVTPAWPAKKSLNNTSVELDPRPSTLKDINLTCQNKTAVTMPQPFKNMITRTNKHFNNQEKVCTIIGDFIEMTTSLELSTETDGKDEISLNEIEDRKHHQSAPQTNKPTITKSDKKYQTGQSFISDSDNNNMPSTREAQPACSQSVNNSASFNLIAIDSERLSMKSSTSTESKRQTKQWPATRRPSQSHTFRAFGTVILVVVAYIIMFAPYWIASVANLGCLCVSPQIFEDYLSVFYYMHSLVNPYIYMVTDRRYKKAIKHKLSQCRCWLKVTGSRTPPSIHIIPSNS